MDITLLKTIILLVMLGVTFFCSMVPVIFIRRISKTHDSIKRTRYHTILSLMSCAAGGVFMGTCLLDLFPDAQKQINIVLTKYELKFQFPVAEFIVVYGLLIVLTLEQIVLYFKERNIVAQPSDLQSLCSDAEQTRKALLDEHRFTGLSCEVDLNASLRSVDHLPISQNCDTTAAVQITDEGHSHNVDFSAHSSSRSFLLLVALSLHSIFEGMAVGLQTTMDNVMELFLVVIFHKGIIALSLSINMVQSRMSVKQILLCNLFFCITAPLGLAIGMGIMEMQASPLTSLISGILQCIACGTFLYVTFFEVLPHEFNNSHHRLPKLLALILGFSCVCAMLYINP